MEDKETRNMSKKVWHFRINPEDGSPMDFVYPTKWDATKARRTFIVLSGYEEKTISEVEGMEYWSNGY